MRIGSIASIGIFLVLQSGCVSEYFQDPLFDNGKRHPQWDYPHAKGLTYKDWVCYGWDEIGHLADPRFGNSCLSGAQDCFETAWKYNHEGYEPYWGWGIIRIRQAERVYSRARQIRYLRDAIRYMDMARSKPSFDLSHANAIALDQAKCWILLGEKLLEDGNRAEAEASAGKAKDLIGSVSPRGDYEKSCQAKLLIKLEALRQSLDSAGKDEEDVLRLTFAGGI